MQLARPWVNIFSARESTSDKVHFLLRASVLVCFAAHGTWGILGKKAWLPFFAVFSVPEQTAIHLLPLVGTIDIAIGICLFFAPMPALLAWATFWTLFTALLRPLAGMGMSEFFERAGNYGIPLALLVMVLRGEDRLRLVRWILTASIASLLIGHGGLAFFLHKASLLNHFASIGLTLTPAQFQLFGLFEIALGILVLVRPRWMGLMVFVLAWKLATESLHPVAGRWIDILETLERAGDYVAPLAVIVLGVRRQSRRSGKRALTKEVAAPTALLSATPPPAS